MWMFSQGKRKNEEKRQMDMDKAKCSEAIPAYQG